MHVLLSILPTEPLRQPQHPLSESSPPGDLDKDDNVVVVDVKQEIIAADFEAVDPNGNTLLGSLADVEGRGGGEGGGGDDGRGGRKSGESDDSDIAEIIEEVHHATREELPLSSIEKALNRMTNTVAGAQSGQDVIPGTEWSVEQKH